MNGYQQICCEAGGRPEKPADHSVCVNADRKPSETQSSDISDSFSVSYKVGFRAVTVSDLHYRIITPKIIYDNVNITISIGIKQMILSVDS